MIINVVISGVNIGNFGRHLKLPGSFHSVRAPHYVCRSVDTAGQPEYDHLRYVSCPKGRVALLAFSLVDRDSFENIKTKWLPEYKRNMPYAKVHYRQPNYLIVPSTFISRLF